MINITKREVTILKSYNIIAKLFSSLVYIYIYIYIHQTKLMLQMLPQVDM